MNKKEYILSGKIVQVFKLWKQVLMLHYFIKLSQALLPQKINIPWSFMLTTSVAFSLTNDEVLSTLQTRRLLIHYKVKLSTSCTSVIVCCSIEWEWSNYISEYNNRAHMYDIVEQITIIYKKLKNI